MSPLVSMIGIGIVHRSTSTALVLFSSLLSHWASSSSYFPTSLSSSSMSMMSTITITIQRFFFSCCCSYFFFLFHPCYFINCCRNFFLSPSLPCSPRLYSSIYPSIIWSLLRRSTPHSTPHTHSRLVSGMYFFVMTSWKGQFIKKIWTVFLSSSRRTKNELRFYYICNLKYKFTKNAVLLHLPSTLPSTLPSSFPFDNNIKNRSIHFPQRIHVF